MKKDILFYEYSDKMLSQLKKGAFLTVKSGDKINTMTIAWGNIGIIWNKPIFTVEVRYSRHTYDLLENSNEFTVSVPLKNDLTKALEICGTESGRDIDKFVKCNITPEKGKVVSTPIVGECELHYECKIVYKQAMEPGTLSKEIKEKYYPKNNFHVLYYGEIVASYIKEY